MRFAILTISDRSAANARPDESGPRLAEAVEQHGWQVADRRIVPDEQAAIQQALVAWCDAHPVDVILTTGGTGFAPRDVTPEATLAVLERQAPGLAEAMRLESLKVTPHAMLSRGVCGIRGRTVIVNLPGSPKAAVENLGFIAPVLPHAVKLLKEDQGSEAEHRSLDHTIT